MVAGALGVLAGCSGGGQSEEVKDVVPADQVAARYGYDLTRSDVLPVNAIVPQFRDPKDGYARDLLAERCLEGTVTYVPAPSNEVLDGMNIRTGELVFDPQVAATSGYPSLRSTAGAESGVPQDVENTDEIMDAMLECGAEADERLGLPPERLLNDIQFAGHDAAEVDERVVEAAARWKECMQPVGVIDLPESPEGMPSPSVVSSSGANSIVDGAGTAAPDPREREVAMADAACRDTAGFPEAIFEAHRDGQLSAIGSNLEEFEAVRLEYIEYEKRLDDVIAELG